jgi:WD40 repeat protein
MLFLQASLLHEAERKAHDAALERRSRNFLRGLVAVFALAAVVAVVLSVYALSASNEARSEANARATQQMIAESEADQRATQQAIAEQEASARATAEAIAIEQREQVFRQASVRLADDAQGQIELGHPERAVLLMLAGLEAYPYTPQAENALARSVVEISNSRLFLDPGRFGWSAVAWSPTDDRIATAIWGKNTGSDSYVLIQDPQTSAEILRIPGEECLGPSNVIWSPSGDRVIVVPQYCDYIPAVRDTQTGELLASLASEPDQAAFSASWSPDGEAILTGSLDGIARIWNAQTGVKRGEIFAHNDYVTQVAWSPSGEFLATASIDDSAKIWDAATGELQYELTGFTDDVSGIAWSPDGEKLVTVSLDKSAQVWDAKTGEMILPLIGHDDKIWDVDWSPDGTYIATDSRDGTARIWDANTGKELFSFRNNRSEEAVLNTIDWSPNSDQLLVMGGVVNQIWDLSAQPPRLSGHGEGLKAAAWSPDGEWIATASLDGTARIWDAASGELLETLVHPEALEDLAWGQEGAQLATSDQAGSVRVWEVGSKSFVEMSNPEDIRFTSLGWSPDGDRIVASSERDLVSVVWDVNTGETIELEQGDLNCYLASPSWSPEGDRFVTGCVKREVKETPARIWDPATGKELERLESQDGNSLVVDWSPDGSAIAVAYSEMIIRTWNVATSQPLFRYSGHADIIADVRWSPNSQRLVSADGGGFVKVWEAATGDEILSFKMTNSLNSVAWSPDGQYVIAATLDPEPGIYRAWQSTDALIDYAEQCCVWRELTIGERQQFSLPLQ